MTPKQILVTKADTAVIQCPECEIRKSIPVGRYKGLKHRMRIKCSCSHVFEIELNFRRHYRKSLTLEATYESKGLNLDAHYDNLTKKKETSPSTTNCTIRDLSAGGVGFENLGKHIIEVGDKLMIFFHLDNNKRTLIHREIMVRTVRGNFVGAQFTESNPHDPELGFYLMP